MKRKKKVKPQKVVPLDGWACVWSAFIMDVATSKDAASYRRNMLTMNRLKTRLVPVRITPIPPRKPKP